MKPLLVSVVRDEAMYEKCIAGNAFCDECELMKIDNREKNEFISVLYNRVLEGLDYSQERWILFAHEDLEFRGRIDGLLERADKGSLYGVIGGRILPRKRWLWGGFWAGVYYGHIWQCNKDGSDLKELGEVVPLGTEVETVDCQFLAVHSSLVEKYHLRFDENLSFDFYAEDFSINASEKYQIKTRILPLEVCHHSPGNIQPRFFRQLRYLDKKYSGEEYFGSSGYNIGTGRTFMRRVQKKVRPFLDAYMPFIVKVYFKIIDAGKGKNA